MPRRRVKLIVVNDKMQKNYKYELTEAPGQNFQPDFQPELTPQEMLQLGVFGGVYLRDCRREFPRAWFSQAKLQKPELRRGDPQLNFFKVAASQPLRVWRKKGWLYDEDPRGWFQWYCRYYQGRRSEDDARQIKRWRAMRRHIAQLKKHCRRGDYKCRPVQRQALLHWAYDSRKL